MFSLIYVWINDWVNNREAGDLRRFRAHWDVIVMQTTKMLSFVHLRWASVFLWQKLLHAHHLLNDKWNECLIIWCWQLCKMWGNICEFKLFIAAWNSGQARCNAHNFLHNFTIDTPLLAREGPSCEFKVWITFCCCRRSALCNNKLDRVIAALDCFTLSWTTLKRKLTVKKSFYISFNSSIMKRRRSLKFVLMKCMNMLSFVCYIIVNNGMVMLIAWYVESQCLKLVFCNWARHAKSWDM